MVVFFKTHKKSDSERSVKRNSFVLVWIDVIKMTMNNFSSKIRESYILKYSILTIIVFANIELLALAFKIELLTVFK